MSKIERSASTNEVPKWKASLGLLVASYALTACGNGGEAKATPETPAATVTVTQEVEPIAEEPVPSETATAPAIAPEDIRQPNNKDMALLSENENALIERMDAMSVEEFEAMPLDKRLLYVIGMDHYRYDNSYFSDVYDQKLNDGTELSQHSIVFMPLNAESNVTEIINQASYAEQLSMGWGLNEEQDDVDDTLDHVTSRKLRSAYALDPKSDVYNVDHVTADPNRTAKLQEEDLNFRQSTEGETKTVINPVDGTETVQKKIFGVMTGGPYEGMTNEATYIFIPTPQLGEGNGLWLKKEATQFE